MKLIDETQFGIAQLTSGRSAQSKNILPAKFDVTAVRRIEASQQMQQRTLAATRRTNDSQLLARCHTEIKIVQNLDPLMPLSIHLLNANGLQRRLVRVTHTQVPLRVLYALRAMPDTTWPIASKPVTKWRHATHR